MLNVWGSWCTPCRAEAPTLAVIAEQYASKDVAFLGDDVNDTPVNALSFIKSSGIPYASMNDSSYEVAQVISQVQPISATPTTVVLDKTGHVVSAILGASSYGELTSLLRVAAYRSDKQT